MTRSDRITSDVYLALLSIDSYNRGYDFNLTDGLNADPDEKRDPDGLGGEGSQMGGDARPFTRVLANPRNA